VHFAQKNSAGSLISVIILASDINRVTKRKVIADEIMT